MIQRMYTLSLIHGLLNSQLTDEERSVIPEGYSDFILADIAQRTEETCTDIGSHILEAYIEVSRKQQKLFEERQSEGTLVFTHGDAKYDNWFNGTLGDFGSCKFSTEYKDVAKALLDSAHHEYLCPAERSIRFLKQNEFSERMLRVMGYAVKNEITEGVFSRELARIKDDWSSGKRSYAEFRREYSRFIRNNLPANSATAIIGDYIDAYLWFRKFTGFPVEESNESFHHNVYEGLLTESVRTIYYKAPMPEKKRVIDRLMKVAEHYTKIADKVRG
jgi:hypothetical protein